MKSHIGYKIRKYVFQIQSNRHSETVAEKMSAALKRAPHPNKRRSKAVAEKISAAALI